ncbi:MAG: hypothetical protein KBA46_00020 [Candidatus Omnitrophica bacterium]|nr:hypothetical protein [Candidatus Omnitrophota bacterium]
MIVPMKKVSILVQAHEAEPTISALRTLGVLHVEHHQAPAGSHVQQLRDDIALIANAETILADPGLMIAAGKQSQEAPSDWKFVCHHLIELRKRLEQLEEYSRTLTLRISDWERWGDFDPDAVVRLREKNIFVRLYEIPVKEVATVPGRVICKVVFTSGGIAHCVVIASDNSELAFKEVSLPKLGLSAMRARLYEDGRMMQIIKDDICKHMAYRKTLTARRKDFESKLEFHEALAGMGQEGAVSYLTGYVPVSDIQVVEAAAQKKRWGLLIQDPSEEDIVPTLLKNPRWVTLIKPLFNLLGITPGYRELDVSLLFLVFFSLFFGILIGDAGYGLAYFLLTAWFQKKKGKQGNNAHVFLFFYLLSSCAMVWGLLTGTFFGQGWLASIGIKPLVPALNDALTMQAICFAIGVVHLSIAHSWRAALKFPHPSALADIGWVCLVWTGFFLARTLILNQPFPVFAGWLLALGVVFVLFFTNPQRNIVKSLGEGFTATGFGIGLMNNLSDIISYIRLFAVGLAGVSIAETTNAMAASLGRGVTAVIAGSLIIVVGHLLNIVLGPMSVLVHGLRLNVLEFSMHANVTWNGIVYRPLKEMSS